METETRSGLRPLTTRQKAMIILVVVGGAILLGNFTTSTTAVSTVSSGPLSISLNATCSGFGPPTYWNSMDNDVNVTTYQYGFCLFGFWVSNGHPVGSPTTGITTEGTAA